MSTMSLSATYHFKQREYVIFTIVYNVESEIVIILDNVDCAILPLSTISKNTMAFVDKSDFLALDILSIIAIDIYNFE